MPLPTDEKLMATAKQLLEMFHGAFGPHPGYRPGKYLCWPYTALANTTTQLTPKAKC
jgi:hypothetical protein